MTVDQPIRATPDRVPGSVRRTSHMDAIWLPADGVDAPPGTTVLLRSGVREVVTGVDGDGRVGSEASLDVWLGPDATVTHVVARPADPRLDDLVGRRASSGFRRAASDAALDLLDEPLGQLLDDVPVAALIANYARLRSGEGLLHTDRDVDRIADVCSGWREGGTLLVAIRRGEPIPLAQVQPANDIAPGDGAVGLPPLEPLPAGSMRRLRRIDVLPGDPTAVDAMFRDTYMEPDGHESILHEYALRAVCDGDGRLLDVEAEPHVLPHIECPDAAPNVVELRGQLTRDLRTIVPVTLEGVRSCTHLSDLLRSLSCVSRLQAIRPA